jgi:hypothetical protein
MIFGGGTVAIVVKNQKELVNLASIPTTPCKNLFWIQKASFGIADVILIMFAACLLLIVCYDAIPKASSIATFSLTAI